MVVMKGNTYITMVLVLFIPKKSVGSIGFA